MKLNKKVFITGGDKGIGRSLVERFAEIYESVLFSYNTNKKGAQELEDRFKNTKGFQCNLKKKEQCTQVANRILNEYEGIDILINNAGVDYDAIFSKMTTEQWDDVLDINLRSLFYFTNPFVNGMIDKVWGRIINFTSIAGFTGAFGKSNYAASKAGMVGFTKSLAIELGRKGITVNAIAPGAIKTDMLMRIPEKYREKILQNIPMARFGETEEVADLVEFLISEKASYITGQTIHINGGSYL